MKFTEFSDLPSLVQADSFEEIHTSCENRGAPNLAEVVSNLFRSIGEGIAFRLLGKDG